MICLNFTFSAIFVVSNDHKTIKVHVNKVQCGRAGHIYRWKWKLATASICSSKAILGSETVWPFGMCK